MKAIIPLLSLLAVVSTFPAWGAEKGSKHALSIFCPVYAAGLKTVFVKTGRDSFGSVALSSANVVTADGAVVTAGKISLHGPTTEDNPYPVVATANVSGMRQPLLLMIPAKEAGGMAYDSKVVEADARHFRMGSFNLVNLSPNSVRITAGGKVIEMKAGEDTLFKPDVPAGGAIPVTIDQQSGGSWQLVSSAQWASRNDRRTLVCFLLDPVSKRMVIKSVPLRKAAAR